jgi:pimeloyl-ACP methyl ester carboxylesterase
MSAGFADERIERAKQILEEIHKISCPTLVMRGARSDVFTDENAQKFAKALPHGRWIKVENAGHTIQGDNPRGLLEVLHPFLKEIRL